MSENTPEAVVTHEVARELTDRIRTSLETACELIKQAYSVRAWSALGYDSWEDYCASEFDNTRVRIPREDRAQVVTSMREIGMSTRAIAVATGLGYGTVQRDLTAPSGDPNGSPDTVIGLDGKQYQPKPVVQQSDPSPRADGDGTAKRKRRPITEAFDTTRYELGKKAESLARLAADDRFDRYADQLGQRHRSDLIRARDAIQGVLDRMPEPTTHPEEG